MDEIVAAKPERDHTRYHSVEELKQHGLQHLREAVELLERKTTPEEVEDYRRFVLTLADKVAKAHREGGEMVSDAERAAIEEISASLGNADHICNGGAEAVGALGCSRLIGARTSRRGSAASYSAFVTALPERVFRPTEFLHPNGVFARRALPEAHLARHSKRRASTLSMMPYSFASSAVKK